MTRLTFPTINITALTAELDTCNTFTEIQQLLDSIVARLAATAADNAGIPRSHAIEPAMNHITNALAA